MESIQLYSVNDEPFTQEQLNSIVSQAIEAGYIPLKSVPQSVRGITPYLSFHFIACSDVPEHQ